MKNISIGIVVLLLVILTIICHAQTVPAKKLGSGRCQKPKNGQHLCFCGKNKTLFDRLQGEKCINGQVVQKGNPKRYLKLQKLKYSQMIKLNLIFSPSALRLTTKPIHQSTRDDNKNAACTVLRFKPRSDRNEQAYVPLRNVSVEAWIDSFTADVTLTQVFVNQEENPIEAVYVFPIEVSHSKDYFYYCHS
jgi:hypothetical protein